MRRPQAQAQSQVRGGQSGGRPGRMHEGGEAAQVQDAAEAFRRHVYVEGLYAKPLGEQAATAGPLQGHQLMCKMGLSRHQSARWASMQPAGNPAAEQLPRQPACRRWRQLSSPDAEHVPWLPDEAALGAAPPSMSEERRQQRLQAWVDRELRALLQSEDTAIVRAYVMGLVRGIGFSTASSSRSSASQVLYGGVVLQDSVCML